MAAGGARTGLLEDILGGELDLRRWGKGSCEAVTWLEGALMGNRGLAEEPWRRWAVEVLEVGEAACKARDSTSSRELHCQPWLTLTMA